MCGLSSTAATATTALRAILLSVYLSDTKQLYFNKSTFLSHTQSHHFIHKFYRFYLLFRFHLHFLRSSNLYACIYHQYIYFWKIFTSTSSSSRLRLLSFAKLIRLRAQQFFYPIHQQLLLEFRWLNMSLLRLGINAHVSYVTHPS